MKVLVTGHKGLVGSAIVRRLKFFGYKKILTISKKNKSMEIDSNNAINSSRYVQNLIAEARIALGLRN